MQLGGRSNYRPQIVGILLALWDVRQHHEAQVSGWVRSHNRILKIRVAGSKDVHTACRLIREILCQPQSCTKISALHHYDLEDYFGDAPIPTQRALRASCRTLEYPPHSLLFSEGEPAKGVFLVKSGELETYIRGASGREVTLRTVTPGDVLGVNETFSTKPHKAGAKTVSKCEVQFIPAFAFRHFLQEHSGAGIGLAKLLSADLEKAYSRIRAMRG